MANELGDITRALSLPEGSLKTTALILEGTEWSISATM
jgi:hypothetical protein